MTTIYLDNVDKFGTQTYLLFDLKTAFLKESQLTREISSHMKTGTYTFSILTEHPAYNKIRLKRSVVRVVDDGETVFRGDVISIDTDKYGTKKVTCQSDIKWLVDIPDIFSKVIKDDTKMYVGSESGAVMFFMRETDRQISGQYVYEHFERNDYISLRYIWSDFGFRETDYAAGLKFTVKIANGDSLQDLEIPIQKAVVKERGNGLSAYIYYIGNVNLAPLPKEPDPDTQEPYADFDPADIDMPTGEIVKDNNSAEMKTLARLDFCIVQYYDPKKEEITGGSVDLNGRYVSHLYIAETPVDSLGRIQWECSATARTTVTAMVNSIFNEYGKSDVGYNLICDTDRKIYRGSVEINGELDYSSVDTIFSNVSKWLITTDGFAGIRYDSGNAYIDLTKESGVKDDSFTVAIGDNVSGYSKSEDVLSLYTGVYVKGTYSAERADVTLVGKQIAAQNADYKFDSVNGIIYHREAKNTFGAIIKYQEYSLDTTAEGSEVQQLYNWAVRDITGMLEAFASFDISAHDPRLLGRAGAVPVLGNYYKVDIPLWGEPIYLPLTKIVTNHVKPSANKLTFGDKKAKLTDYTAERRA